jgi:Mrp family chromosome partitioning ATPase/capsular polysaccharide biosynthesis protein
VKFDGAESLKLALRRSAVLLIVLPIVGAVTMVLFRQHEGASYSASAQVLYSTTRLADALAGTASGYVDPSQVQSDALFFANSSQFYDETSRALGGSPSSGAIQGMTSVTSPTTTTLSFNVSNSNPALAIRVANALAAQYKVFRAEVAAKPATDALAQAKLLSKTEGLTADLKDQIARLELLRSLNSGDVLLVQRTTGAAKTRPRPLHDALLGAALGLVLALFIAAVREALDTRVRRVTDIEEILGAPVLSTVPRFRRRRRGALVVGPNSSFGDAYALLAASLGQRLSKGPRVIAVTSAIQNEGKTTTAANLALALALRGARVVLVDLDFRKSSLARAFHIPAGTPGASQVMAGQLGLDQALWSIKVEGAAISSERQQPPTGKGAAAAGGSLVVLPAGPPVESVPVGEFDRVEPLLKRLSQNADWVIVDTPPALQTFEMAELGQHVDMVVVVVRHGLVTHRMLDSVARRAQLWDAEIAGAVLTWAPSAQGYGYGYGYGYGQSR